MKIKLILALLGSVPNGVIADDTPVYLEPAGLGPFEVETTAQRQCALSRLFRLGEDVDGFKFALICLLDDDQAFATIVRQERDAVWVAIIREIEMPIGRAQAAQVHEREVKIDAVEAQHIYGLVMTALRGVGYPKAGSDDLKPFTTGGVETFIAARVDRVFMAGRTWDPTAGTKPWLIQQWALRLRARAGEIGSPTGAEPTVSGERPRCAGPN